MGLSMAERQAVTRETAARYRRASKARKKIILDELCASTGWHRDHARRRLREVAARPVGAGRKRATGPIGRRRPPVYDEDLMAVIRKAWAVLDAPCGKRLAPVLPAVLAALEGHGELHLTPAQRRQTKRISAATLDRRLAPDRRALMLKGRSGTKPGGLLKHQIPIRTFADWDDARPGFGEVDLVGHEGGNPAGEFAQTLTLTDVACGWTENQAVCNKARKWVIAALEEIAKVMPFAILGVDSDNGSSSSIVICCATVRPKRSPSPAAAAGRRTTTATSNRRTGRWSAGQSATCATTPQPNSRCSTSSTPTSG
ncbi:MAG: hypothetical protein ACYCO3_10240 [Mycobacteriales bacterium]